MTIKIIYTDFGRSYEAPDKAPEARGGLVNRRAASFLWLTDRRKDYDRRRNESAD